MNLKRILSLTLTLALGITLMAGCSKGASTSSQSGASSSSATSSAPTVEPMDMTGVTDPYLATAGIAGDTVVAKAIATMDMEEQVSLYKRAQEILNEQAASLWLQDLCDLVVLDPALDGMTFYATYVLDMSTIYYK